MNSNETRIRETNVARRLESVLPPACSTYTLHLREQRRVALFTALKLSRRHLIVHLNNQFTTGHNRNHELASLRQPSHRNCANHKYYGAYSYKGNRVILPFPTLFLLFLFNCTSRVNIANDESVELDTSFG